MHEAERVHSSHPPESEVKNMWSFIPTPPIYLLAQENLRLTFENFQWSLLCKERFCVSRLYFHGSKSFLLFCYDLLLKRLITDVGSRFLTDPLISCRLVPRLLFSSPLRLFILVVALLTSLLFLFPSFTHCSSCLTCPPPLLLLYFLQSQS